MVGLLDVNMLIALAWPSHVHHTLAHAWFSRHSADGWASCPLTQCGFIRISSNRKIIPEAVAPRHAVALLRRITKLPGHVFWPDDIMWSDPCIPEDFLVGHRQVTDAYLLGLAIRNKGRLITLDKGLSSLLTSSSPNRKSLCIVSKSP
jgi:toxin-antitoxin system PIN domain toxin